MYYSGKKMDLFEMSVQQMLEDIYGFSVENLDCMGGRCFGFRMGETIRDWFIPRVDMKEAVNAINDVSGLRLKCRLCRKSDEHNTLANMSVIGPLEDGFAVPEMKNYYYNGQGCFIYVRVCDDEYIKVFDPQGLPGIKVKKKELLDKLSTVDVYEIYHDTLPLYYKIPDKLQLLTRGLFFHKKIEREERRNIDIAVQKYVSNMKNKIALQYAIKNLIIQMDKVFILASESEIIDMNAEKQYGIYKQQIYEIGQNEAVWKIPEILSRIWRLLDDKKPS